MAALQSSVRPSAPSCWALLLQVQSGYCIAVVWVDLAVCPCLVASCGTAYTSIKQLHLQWGMGRYSQKELLLLFSMESCHLLLVEFRLRSPWADGVEAASCFLLRLPLVLFRGRQRAVARRKRFNASKLSNLFFNPDPPRKKCLFGTCG